MPNIAKKQKKNGPKAKPKKFFKKPKKETVEKRTDKKFPKIPRRFPEFKIQPLSLLQSSVSHDRKTWLAVGITLLTMVLLFSLGFVAFRTMGEYRKVQKAQAERADLMRQIHFWESIIKKYPGYRDAFFTLSTLEYRVGNTEMAVNYLQKALEIDPNFQKGREFEKILKE